MSKLEKTSHVSTRDLSKEEINSLLVKTALNELKRKEEESKQPSQANSEGKDPKKEDETGAVMAVKKEEIVSNSIQVISDIHLEFDNVYDLMPKIKPKAPIIALLGDIGYPEDYSYYQFLKELSQNFQHVIIIAGNHEYYSSEYNNTHQRIFKICEELKNVHFLQCTTIEFPDVLPNIRIAGCTLWTTYDEYLRDRVKFQVNDYTMIGISTRNNEKKSLTKDPDEEREEEKEENDQSESVGLVKVEKEKRILTVEDTEQIHNEHVTWLMKEIEKIQMENETCPNEDQHKQLVILTHHAPTDYHCVDPRLIDPVSIQLDCCHLEHLFQYPVGAWFFGHTHYNMECVVQSVLEKKDKEKTNSKEWLTLVASNQQGYLHDDICDKYQADKVFSLPVKQSQNYEVVAHDKMDAFYSLSQRIQNLKS